MLNFIQVSFCFLLFLGLGFKVAPLIVKRHYISQLKCTDRQNVHTITTPLLPLLLSFDNKKYLIGGAANTLDIPCR